MTTLLPILARLSGDNDDQSEALEDRKILQAFKARKHRKNQETYS
jgi:hypothetical protein